MTTSQSLFDRWISEAIAMKVNPRKQTRIEAAERSARVKALLDCAAQLQCVHDLPGKDPRDPGGLNEHFNRIADRASATAQPLPDHIVEPDLPVDLSRAQPRWAERVAKMRAAARSSRA